MLSQGLDHVVDLGVVLVGFQSQVCHASETRGIPHQHPHAVSRFFPPEPDQHPAQRLTLVKEPKKKQTKISTSQSWLAQMGLKIVADLKNSSISSSGISQSSSSTSVDSTATLIKEMTSLRHSLFT